jgi:hypothetical protein
VAGARTRRIGVQLTATTRTALGAFVSPAPPVREREQHRGHRGDDLLFKVGDSANGSTASQVHLIGSDELRDRSPVETSAASRAPTPCTSWRSSPEFRRGRDMAERRGGLEGLVPAGPAPGVGPG